MFSFLNMMGNYEERRVQNTIVGEIEIDTCAVTDSSEPFETGICSKFYNDGSWVIVEMYSTKEAAIKGHKKWVKKMKSPPATIKEVGSCEIVKLGKYLGIDLNKQFNFEIKSEQK